MESKQAEKKIVFGMDYEKVKRTTIVLSVVLSINHLLLPLHRLFYALTVDLFKTIDILILAVIVLSVGGLIVSESNRKESCLLIKNFFSKDQILIGIIPLILVFSCLYKAISGDSLVFKNNFDYIMDMVIGCFIMYPIGKYVRRVGIGKRLECFFHIVLLLITVYAAQVLITVFQGGVVRTPAGGIIGINVIDFGIEGEFHLLFNCHHNTTGAYAATIMLICLCMVVWKKGILRISYLLGASIHMTVLILANSRSTFISAAFFISILVAILSFHYFKDSKKVKRMICFVIGGFVAAVVFIGLNFVRKGCFDLFVKSSGYNAENEIGAEEISRDLALNNLMGRDLIWKASIKGMTANAENALLGVTPHKVVDTIDENSEIKFGVYTHNQFLEIGLSIGIPALIIFTIWMVYLAVNCLQIGLLKGKRFSIGQKVVPLFIMFLVVYNLVEATLFFYQYFPGCLFIILAGWVMGEKNRNIKVPQN